MNIVLFDSGIDPQTPLPENFVNLITHQPGLVAKSNRHAERIAMLCSASIGPMADMTLYCAHYSNLFPHQIGQFLRDQRVEAKIVGMPFSAPETYTLAIAGSQALIADLETTEGALLVAPSGHDGKDRVRFPGTCNFALTVGLAGEDKAIDPRSGHDDRLGKPDISVPNRAYKTRYGGGEEATIEGTSAGVALICALAARLLPQFSENGYPATPWALRSAVLAATEPIQGPVSCKSRFFDPDSPWQDAPLTQVLLDTKQSRRFRLTIRTQGADSLRIGVATKIAPGSSLWLPPDCTVTFEDSSNPQDRNSIVNHGAIDALAVERGYIVTISDRCSECAISVVGVDQCEITAEPIFAAKRTKVTGTCKILGLSASHDASAALVIDGELRHAIQLERISRKKHDGEPFLSHREHADYVLAAAGLSPADIDIFAFNSQPLYPGQVGLRTPLARDFTLFDPLGERARYVSHHLCHAYSAYYLARQAEADVLVMDGSGGNCLGAEDLYLKGPELRAYLEAAPSPTRQLPNVHVMSAYHFGPYGHRLIARETAASFNVRHGTSSIGETYAAVANYIFGSWHASGKVMGLAPYGLAGESLLVPEVVPPQFGSIWKLAHDCPDGAVMDHADLAATVQRDFEDALIARIEALRGNADFREMMYAGGLALNCKANTAIENRSSIGKLTVFPAASDAGIAVGAALAASREKSASTIAISRRFEDFLGYEYSNSDIDLCVRHFRDFVDVENIEPDAIAQRLAQGAIIGLFVGASEFGPRALGHRSIIAAPHDPAIRDRLNRDVKYREEFRPFAPVTLEDCAERYFETGGRSFPYMTHTVDVRAEWRHRLAAVTHVDGSARLQTVGLGRQPVLEALLRAMERQSGAAVLINTSMNVRGQPIVETPFQAMELLLCSGLDQLILGDRLLSPLSDSWRSVGESGETGLALSLAPDTEIVMRKGFADMTSYEIQAPQRSLAFTLDREAVELLEDAILHQRPYEALSVSSSCRDGLISALLALKLLLLRRASLN